MLLSSKPKSMFPFPPIVRDRSLPEIAALQPASSSSPTHTLSTPIPFKFRSNSLSPSHVSWRCRPGGRGQSTYTIHFILSPTRLLRNTNITSFPLSPLARSPHPSQLRQFPTPLPSPNVLSLFPSALYWL